MEMTQQEYREANRKINSQVRCHWCAKIYEDDEFKPACSEDHLKRLTPFEPQYKDKIKLWAKFVNHQYAAWSALFELITNQKSPKLREINNIISGHSNDTK